MHPHLQALSDALVMEESWQRDEHARLLALPLPERVWAGLSWSPLKLLDSSNVGRGRTVLTLQSPAGITLHDGISAGDLVRVAPIGAPDKGPIGRCLGADPGVCEVRIEEDLHIDGPIAVTKSFDNRTFERFQLALQRGDAVKSPLAQLLRGERHPGEPSANSLHHPCFDRLNPEQHRAARIAVGTAEAALIHGPPGTGKTEVITSLLKAFVSIGYRPLGLAESNAAVDHLTLRAHRAGLKVIRLGHPERIDSEVRQFTFPVLVPQGPMGMVLASLDRELSRLPSGSEHWKERNALLDERRRLEMDARDALLAEAQVITSTFGTLARQGPYLPKVQVAVVDEATQAIEPAVWTAVGLVDRVVLVGDPKQLGPVVRSPNNPLSTSLLDRLLHTSDLPMPMLEVQHRMSQGIQALVDGIYDGRLRAHPSVASRTLSELGVQGRFADRSAVWIDTAGAGWEEQRDPVTHSLLNEGEAVLVERVVRMLLEDGVHPDDIGVIAPYSAQVARLSKALPEVKVATVNAFQGREKEAIVCSWVRSNDTGELGFVADERRLTVALTRARRLLVNIGDSATLGGHPRFESVLASIEIESVWEEPWFQG